MRFGVIVFPGSNCDQDCFHALKDVLKQEVDYIWHKDPSISGYDCIILPGGFSYGDYLRTGAIAKFSPVMKSVIREAKKGKPVIGICNGFQILLEAGLLPGAMLRNRNLRFICKYVYVSVENSREPFTKLFSPGDILKIPIAHGEGCYYADKETIKRLERQGQVIFRYCDSKGMSTESANPNGSLGNIAGICNEEGNVLGMMPHPERSSEKVLGSEDGRRIFQSILKEVL